MTFYSPQDIFEGFLEPLFAVYPIKKSCYKAKENLKKGNLKLSSLLDNEWQINYLSIEHSIKKLDKNLFSFFNINQPKEVNELMKIYQSIKKKNFY